MWTTWNNFTEAYFSIYLNFFFNKKMGSAKCQYIKHRCRSQNSQNKIHIRSRFIVLWILMRNSDLALFNNIMLIKQKKWMLCIDIYLNWTKLRAENLFLFKMIFIDVIKPILWFYYSYNGYIITLFHPTNYILR